MKLLLVLALAAFPSTARAECELQCDAVCGAPDGAAFFRAEVVEALDGWATRVRLVERLSGGTDLGQVGDQLSEGVSTGNVVVGGFVFLTLARHSNGISFVYSEPRPLEGGDVLCPDRRVAVQQYAEMAASNDCRALADTLELTTPCDDNGGCSASTQAPHALAALGVLGVLGVVARRRRGRGSARMSVGL